MGSKSPYMDVEFKQEDENYGWTKLFELFDPKTKVLDVGCSSGNFGKVLIDNKQCSVIGIDINEDDLKRAGKNLTKVFKKNIERDDISELGKFDYILLADIIEHLVDPVFALEKLKKALAPNGKLIFSVPNMANIANRIELLGGRFEYTKFGLLDETHMHYYDRVEFEKTLSRAGFVIKKYNNTIRDLPSAVITAQLKKLGLTSSNKFLKLAQSTDSVTFQFIGVAQPSSLAPGKHVPVESKVPYDFFSRQFDAVHKHHHEQLSQLKSELEQQKQAKDRAEHEIKNAQAKLIAIENSKGWKLLTKFYTAKKTLSSVFRRK